MNHAVTLISPRTWLLITGNNGDGGGSHQAHDEVEGTCDG